MEYGYLVKVLSRTIYKEFQLPYDSNSMRIGMSKNCDLRLYSEDFFEAFQLDIVKKNGVWTLFCSDNVYVDCGDVRKLLSQALTLGDSVTIKYQSSNQEVFKLEFQYDFDNVNKDYNLAIEIPSTGVFTIGNASNSNIIIKSPYVQNDYIALEKRNGDLVLGIYATTCGVYHNAKEAVNGEVIKNGDFLSIADISFYYKNGQLLTEASNSVVTELPKRLSTIPKNYPKFTRNTRIRKKMNSDKIEVLDPPNKPNEPKNNILVRLLPSLGMVAMGVMFASKSPFMLVTSGIGIVTAIISLVDSKKNYKKETRERIEKYNNYIDRKTVEIKNSREEEIKLLDEIYISANKENELFESFSPDLFDRTEQDDDFLVLRLGLGDVKSKREIDYKKQEKLEIEDDLQEKPQKLHDEFEYLHGCPVVVDLKTVNAIGVIGDEQYRFDYMKTMIVDICARQYHSDVKFIFIAEDAHRDRVRWLRMLPHVHNDVLGINNIVCDDESRNVVFEYLYKELTLRAQEKSFPHRIIVFVYDEYGIKNHPLSRFVDSAKDLGITFVFFADKKADVALGCNYIIDVKSDSSAVVKDVSGATDDNNIQYATIPDEAAKNIVSLMAPVYTEEISLESSLTKSISLFKLLNIMTVEDVDLKKNWEQSQVFKSMAAPLGVSKSGVIELDLHDKAHGPHGLVAGTTGSGKSEILQTYILSMATLYHPYEVSFVIIDFKGGGMVNQFRTLPHLVGAITNIDGKEIDRSLKSIKAELKKRQRYFAEAEVNHIDKYIKKYRDGEVKNPLPHLILIVDEFAELKAEQPEFMKELISAARIGRSLGVHLILATQKPAGQVNDQIWSNSRFKLCLKVQDQSDSNEVLKSPLAAEIKEPGRAYLQVGNNEIFELFQSAYSGAPEKADADNMKEFSIYAITDSGRRIPAYVQKKKSQDKGSRTQLDAIVEYVHNYTTNSGIEKLPDICLPPLPAMIPYENDITLGDAIPVGVFDDPDNQLQDGFGIDIFSENSIVLGSAMTGKTNLLQLLIKGIANNYSPSEVSIYIIDFASMVLKNFEKLKHVGGVVVPSEDEKLKNLFKLINEEMIIRKEKLLAAGVSSFQAYKEAGNTDLAQIVLMVDNHITLRELYFAEEDFLLPICRDGLSLGISVIVANTQMSGLGYKYMSNINQKIAFTCNDKMEYSSLFGRCRLEITNTPGRMIVERDKELYEAQSYIAFNGEKEFERVKEIASFIEEINSKYDVRAPRIPVVPEHLFENILEDEYGVKTDMDHFVLGLDYASVAPICLDWTKQDVLAVTSESAEKKISFNNYLMSTVVNNDVDAYVVDDYSGTFENIEDHKNVALYTKDLSNLEEILDDIRGTLSERHADREIGGLAALKNKKPIILIINSSEAIKYISENKPVLEIYKDIVRKYKNLKSMIIYTNVENQAIQYSSPEALKMMQDNQQFLMFDDIKNIKIFNPPQAVVRKFKVSLKDNEAYFLSGNKIMKVKTVIKR